MSGLTQRIITGIIFGVVMIGGVLYNELSFIILFGIIGAFCLWEFLDMSLKGNEANYLTTRKIIGVLSGLIIYYIVISFFRVDGFHIGKRNLFEQLRWLLPAIFFMPIIELYTNSKNPFNNISLIIFGIIYTIVPCILAYLIPINNFDSPIESYSFHSAIILGLLFLTWANDVGAYFVGSKFGKTKLFPRISPKKTWEGSFGGVAMTFLTGWLLSLYVTELDLKDWLILALIVSIFGSIGDLVESMLKRSVGVKDSGTILPGHGGFLDRFDAFIFLLPFAACYLLWLR